MRTPEEIVAESRSVAIVGLSPEPDRPSHGVALYLQQAGFKVVPVNPNFASILEETCYPSLLDIPFPIDLVDVFRRPEAAVSIAQDAVAIGAGALWLQLGIVNDEAARIAHEGDLDVVMDQCTKVVHARMTRAGGGGIKQASHLGTLENRVLRAPWTSHHAIVVIPTYNEAANLPVLIAAIMELDLPRLEVLVVDDNSPDGTADVAGGLGLQYDGRVIVVRRSFKRGLGSAYRDGFAAALARGAEYVVEMDADLSHSPEYLPRLLEQMSDYDVAVGSRWVPGGGTDRDWDRGRRLLSRSAGLYSRLVLGLKINDPTTGYKCFRSDVLLGISFDKIKSRGFVFQVEVAYACQRKGYRVAEVPITFRSRYKGRSKMSAGILIEALWRILAIRFERHRGP